MAEHSIGFWRRNTIEGLRMTSRSPGEAQDPEQFERILSDNKELGELQARERLVRERAARIANRTHIR